VAFGEVNFREFVSESHHSGKKKENKGGCYSMLEIKVLVGIHVCSS